MEQHKAKKLIASVKNTAAKPVTNIWAWIQSLFCAVQHMSSQIHVSGTESYTNASMKSTGAKLSGCVRTDAALQMPYLSHV